ncbi:Chromatin assembly factor 1 subunit B, partial [Smittium culicis]
MKVKTAQINWHEKLPIFSADFDKCYNNTGSSNSDPAENKPRKTYRFATGGADSNVRIWNLNEYELQDLKPIVEFRANLSRHTAPVNVVRFCPIDGAIIIWKEVEKNQSNSNIIEGSLFGEDSSLIGSEIWKPISILRGSLADIYDLAWSPDGKFIISGSIDNTSRIWDTST